MLISACFFVHNPLIPIEIYSLCYLTHCRTLSKSTPFKLDRAYCLKQKVTTGSKPPHSHTKQIPLANSNSPHSHLTNSMVWAIHAHVGPRPPSLCKILSLLSSLGHPCMPILMGLSHPQKCRMIQLRVSSLSQLQWILHQLSRCYHVIHWRLRMLYALHVRRVFGRSMKVWIRFDGVGRGFDRLVRTRGRRVVFLG